MGCDTDPGSSVIQKALLLICCYGMLATCLQGTVAAELKKPESVAGAEAGPIMKLPGGHANGWVPGTR
jgi:hypothetical protein